MEAYMINIVTNQNFLSDTSDGIVIPVNTVGVAGAGLAVAWAKKHPEAARLYKTACRNYSFGIGNIFVVTTTPINKPLQHFLCFPTKEHWRNPSRMEYIEAGLPVLAKTCERLQLTSIAVPALGCGLGGLRWQDIKPVLIQYLGGHNMTVRLYPSQ
jgi:O-acetyl-ADP-ribose deacetylase (regulator of RNase III)